MRLRLVPQDTSWDFFAWRRVTFGASVVAVILSLVAWGVIGLNFGIDFLGGTTIRTESAQPVDVGAYRQALAPLGLGDVAISEVFDPTFGPERNVSQIRIQAQEGDEAVTAATIRDVQEALGSEFGGQVTVSFISSLSPDDIVAALDGTPFAASAADDGVAFAAGMPFGSLSEIEKLLAADDPGIQIVDPAYELLLFPSVESVGPKVSGELIWTAILAVAGAIGAMLVYIWLRFEWQFAVGAVAALVHDVILTVGIFSLLQIRFDQATIAALLTVLGYSVNDTVVIFDRLRENLVKYKKTPLIEVMNRSVNETLSRTLMTSGTTLIALIALLVLGGDVIRGFVFAITWGVIVGTYSSVYVAKNVVLMLGVDRGAEPPSEAEAAGA